jgi:hypothetical protein
MLHGKLAKCLNVILLSLIRKDVFLQNNLERIHLYELDCWMVTDCENQVISIKLIKRPESMTYMLHP